MKSEVEREPSYIGVMISKKEFKNESWSMRVIIKEK